MQSRMVKSVLLVTLLLGTIAHAEEEEGKPAAAAEDKNLKEYGEKNGKLNTLASKIEEADKKFEELVKQKAEAKTQAEKQGLIKELNETDAERSKAKAEYDKLKSELALRFPNQGVNSKRNYSTEGAKPKDNKGAESLDELLTRTKKVIDKKFAAFNEGKKTESEAKKEVEKKESEKRLRLEK